MNGTTYLANADIDKHKNRVLVTTRSLGRPSSPQPQTRSYTPRAGQTIEQLYRELIYEFANEDGE